VWAAPPVPSAHGSGAVQRSTLAAAACAGWSTPAAGGASRPQFAWRGCVREIVRSDGIILECARIAIKPPAGGSVISAKFMPAGPNAS
jgi:hypothetical protein